MNINRELMRNLAESQAENDAAAIFEDLKVLGVRFAWSMEEMVAVAELVADSRKKAIEGFSESMEAVMADIFGARQ